MKLSRKIAATLAVLVAAVPPVIAREGERRSGAESERGVIATVNGDPIYFEALERYLGELHQGAAEAERRAPDMERALFRLVNDALLAQEARALGMHEEEPIPSRVATRRENRAVKRLEQEVA